MLLLYYFYWYSFRQEERWRVWALRRGRGVGDWMGWSFSWSVSSKVKGLIAGKWSIGFIAANNAMLQNKVNLSHQRPCSVDNVIYWHNITVILITLPLSWVSVSYLLVVVKIKKWALTLWSQLDFSWAHAHTNHMSIVVGFDSREGLEWYLSS